MFLHEVLEQLEELGIHIANSTLRNYQNNKLIPPAKRRSLGRWKGTITEYPDHAVPEIYATYHMLNGELMAKVDLLRRVRETVLAIEEDPNNDPPHEMIMSFACTLWVAYRHKAQTGKDCVVDFLDLGNGTYIRIIDY